MNKSIRKKLKKEFLHKLRKRPKTLFELLLKKEEVSTYELEELGYNQPPRVAQDLKEAGIKLRVRNDKHPKTGNRMAVYSLDPDQSIDFRLGRIAFPKEFSKKLFEKYGHNCNITGTHLPANALQVDHRVPFIVRCDGIYLNLDDFQPLSASAQRSKSWACEHCPNKKRADVNFCKKCFWAYPENYEHVAGVEERQVVLTFQNEDVLIHAKLLDIAKKAKQTVSTIIINLLRPTKMS